uniref:Uncharacterized protein n=1 Tax=Ciona intestinalis TaxID=7719 RepID=H2XPF7_CIOIN
MLVCESTSDIRLTHVKKMWARSPDCIFADVGKKLVHASANKKVT